MELSIEFKTFVSSDWSRGEDGIGSAGAAEPKRQANNGESRKCAPLTVMGVPPVRTARVGESACTTAAGPQVKSRGADVKSRPFTVTKTKAVAVELSKEGQPSPSKVDFVCAVNKEERSGDEQLSAELLWKYAGVSKVRIRGGELPNELRPFPEPLFHTPNAAESEFV